MPAQIVFSACASANFYYFLGSPAEKADLEVADEILEINGESMDNSNHTDVIAHIHNVSYLPYSILCWAQMPLQKFFYIIHSTDYYYCTMMMHFC